MFSEDKKRQEFFEELQEISTTGIGLIKFVSGMNGFVASTPTMKKLGLLLMERYGKAKFAPNELAPSYQFIMAYIFSTLEFQEQIMIEGAFQSFVQNGGEIQIVKRATRETFIDETPIPIKILKKFIYLITGIVTL